MDEMELSDGTLNRKFRLHLLRGIGYLATTHMIKAISDLVGLATRVDPADNAGLGTELTDT